MKVLFLGDVMGRAGRAAVAGLSARGPVLAIGFVFAGHKVEAVPTDSTDQHLDLIVTEMKGLTIA